MPVHIRTAIALCSVALTAGCGCGHPLPSGASQDDGADSPGRLAGQVTYEARHPTAKGASRALETRPARFVKLDIVGAGGEVLAQGTTDGEGRFDLPRPGGSAQVVVWAMVKTDVHDVAVTEDREGIRTHRMVVPLTGASDALKIHASDSAPPALAGAFHIADSMAKGLEKAAAWTGREMPPVFVYWGRGVTTEWSFYRGQVPRGSGRYSFELLGGNRGQQHTTDTDEHDEAIMVHELGHMVMDLTSTDSSVGGRHPPGYLVDPGLAWEEGRVSWFATAALGDPTYQDTIGVEPTGRLRVDRDYSRVNAGPQGIGSEQTVGEVLWDLADGAGGIPDADNDGVALGPEGLMQAMMAMREVDGAFPCLASFLRFLVTSGRVAEMDLKQMLARTGQPAGVLPSNDVPVWPVELATLPAEVSGSIDGLSNPAPSGGPSLPSAGFDAMRAYRFRLTGPHHVSIALAIEGSGRVADNADLDLELRNADGRPYGEARTESAVETLHGLRLPAGWYIIHVRDGGRGNRARFRLSVRAQPVM